MYNIPARCEPRALRPLGRLALADHARQAGQRIRRAMIAGTDAESMAVSEQTRLGNEFRSDALRVYVVASISGGTGGGMALDIGYAVRAILEKLGVAESASVRPDDALDGRRSAALRAGARQCVFVADRISSFSAGRKLLPGRCELRLAGASGWGACL